jgi:hypothetical protein
MSDTKNDSILRATGLAKTYIEDVFTVPVL